jgi:hypothetical protein
LVWAWTKYSRLGKLAAQNTDWLRDFDERPAALIKYIVATIRDGVIVA